MTKVYCADVSCKYVNDKGVCTQKKIGLGWSSVVTVNDGRQEFHRCKMYEESESAREIRKFFEKQKNNT